MKKLVMLTLCFGMMCVLLADANTDTRPPITDTELPTNASPFQLQNSQMRRVPDSRVLLYSQIPTNSANSYACQLDSVYPFDADLVEDVTPTADWTLDSIVSYVRPWGAWSSWALVPNVRFLVYADSSIGSHPVDSPFVDIVVNQGTYETAVYGSGWLVGLPLSSSVNLSNGVTYWLEVQPCFSFAANGQSGTMAEPGIGNGLEFFYRFPILGVPVFVPASAGGWTGCEGGIELYGNPTVSQVTWDFETGHQGWTHTNGQPYPAGWDVQPSGTHGAWTPPSADDSTYWMDSDANGGGYADTALSPVCTPLASMDWLWYGVGYNWISAGEWLEVGIKTFDGSSWTVVPLRTYTTDTGPMWDSVDVSAYAGAQRIQVYFFYDDVGIWAWYCAFDNVTIAATVYVPSDDVGTTDIVAPGTLIMPNTTLDPTATYENFGTDTETFDVYFVIDSLGQNIYNQTANITLDSGSDTTISFASWTCCGTDGIVYDVKAYTVFGADIDPSNDTLSQTTTVNASFWEILADIPVGSSGHSESTVHDGVYLVTGFHTSTTYPPTVYEYDIANDTWATGTPNAFGCGTYGMAYGALGKHYRICGTDAWPTGLTRVDIYDPVADVWSAGATAPMANMDQIGGVYNDSLIFMLGGGNWGGSVAPHTNVHFYDIYADAWTTATNFTGVGRGCLAGGVIGDYAIVAAGYDGSTYRNDYIVGNIDPANPANITWGSPTTIPGGFEGRYRVLSGVDAPATQAQELWVTCGQGVTNPQCSDIWSYEPISDVWTNYYLPKNLAVGNVNSLAITTTALGDIGVYVVGGYTGSYVTDHEVFHTGKVTVEEMPGQQDPSSVFGFAANMKNPTDGYSAITYTTTKPGKVMVKVYDGTGRLVKTLVNRAHEPVGTKTVYWNAKDDGSRTVANGVYFVRLEADGKVDTHKMILVK
ncbi:MAG: T9SS type A sorting domain-containing protein [bacterium]